MLRLSRHPLVLYVPALADIHRCCFFFFNDTPPPEIYTFPYTTLFRSLGPDLNGKRVVRTGLAAGDQVVVNGLQRRSEEHTSELQSLRHLVCRLLLEKKKDRQGGANTGDAAPSDHAHRRRRDVRARRRL